jgi:acetyl esterase/lipase
MRPDVLRSGALAVIVVAVAAFLVLRDGPAPPRTPLAVGADVVLDVTYGDGPRSTLDVYRPGGSGPHPTIVYFHPGGWVAGDKSMSMPVWDWTERGYAVVAVNYRYAVAPDTIADALADAGEAMAFVSTNGGRWDLDVDRIGMVGFSAGGHLVALLAGSDTPAVAAATIGAPTDLVGLLDPSVPYFDGETGDAVVSTMRSRLGCGPVVDARCLDEAARLSPALGPDDSVPLYIVHGADDPIVAPSNAEALFARLRSQGAEVELELVVGGGHGPRTRGLAAFFDQRLGVTSADGGDED